MPRTLALVIAAIGSALLLAGGATPAYAQLPYVSASSTCSPDSSYVIWNTFDPAHANPDWVGFDVLHRALPGCGEYVRANDEIIPRQAEAGYVSSFRELSNGTTVEYRVVPVDVNRQALFLGGQFCSPCNAFVSCPPNSSPITVGTILDLAKGFWFVIPCPGTCYPEPYFEHGVPSELARYVGTNEAFSFFGSVTCGGVEGCYFSPLDHWVAASCVTPTATRTWGRLKTIYR